MPLFGTLAAASPNAGATMLLYTATEKVTVNINLCNTNNATKAKVRLGVTTQSAPAIFEYREYDATLQPAGGEDNGNVIERTALPLGVGEKVFMYADVAGVGFQVYGVN